MNIHTVIHTVMRTVTGGRRATIGADPRTARLAAAAALMISAVLFGVPAAVAAAEPCPDIEVVFARGTDQAAGVGGTGQAYIDALRAPTGARSIGVYPVEYAANHDFAQGLESASAVVDGITDAATHIESTATNCPDTDIVLGGYSQGAAVSGFVTSPVVPAGLPTGFVSTLPEPMPPEVADHVAAVVLFAKPSPVFLQQNGAPPVTIGPLYAPKTLELCAEGDTICNGASEIGLPIAHVMYPMNGAVDQAADFTVGRLGAREAA